MRVGDAVDSAGYTASVASLVIAAEARPAASIGTIWSSPWITRIGTSKVCRSSVKSVSENALMQS
jgi:hypothetical protein